MRAFVCTYLDAEWQARCHAVIDQLVASSEGRLRSVPQGTAHLTYAFIAALPDEQLPALIGAVAKASARVPALRVTLGPPSILYGGSEARLVHLPAVDGREALANLARTLADATRDALPGVDVTPTPAPHVTLARFRRRTRKRDARGVEDAIARHHATLRMDIDVAEVHIVESRIGAGGPQYLPRATASLAVR